MKNLNLHSFGKSDYLKALKESFIKLSFEVKNNQNLTQEEKEVELKILKEKYSKEKKSAGFGLFLKT